MEEAREGNQGLRACGEAGKEHLKTIDMAISPQYISKLTRMLVQEGYILKARKGRHYVVAEGDRWGEFYAWLDNDAPKEWGRENVKEREWPLRLKAFNLQRAGMGVRVNSKNMIPGPAFRLIWSMFKRGEYDLVLVPAGTRTVTLERKGKKWGVGSEPEYWDEIDHEGIQEQLSDED